MEQDERQIDSFRSHTAKWLFGSFQGWIWLGLTLIGFALLIYFQNPWPLIVTGVGVAGIVWKWLQFMAAKYEVTTQRLIMRRGIIMKNIDEIELYRVKDVKVSFSLLNQLVNIGNIALTSSDRTNIGVPLVLPYVENARERREQIRAMVQSERVRRGVREIDYEPDAVRAVD